MPAKRFNGVDPLNDSSVGASDAAIFGATEGGAIVVPPSGRQTASPINISQISPDVRQPRRAIPASIRAHHATTEQQMAAWKEAVESDLGAPLSISMAQGEDITLDGLQPLTADLLDLLALAASIHRDGLTNPITVAEQGGRYTIETGERRYCAYHLLTLMEMPQYARIPARIVPQVDVWRQAAENGARKPLNAIGIARQIAVLIMDMYPDHPWQSPDVFGGATRAYYAQAANGNEFRVKSSLSERVLQVTGIKSMGMVRQYRALLAIPDDIWNTADEENWPLMRIVDYLGSVNKLTLSHDSAPAGSVNKLTLSHDSAPAGSVNKLTLSPDSALPFTPADKSAWRDSPAIGAYLGPKLVNDKLVPPLGTQAYQWSPTATHDGLAFVPERGQIAACDLLDAGYLNAELRFSREATNLPASVYELARRLRTIAVEIEQFQLIETWAGGGLIEDIAWACNGARLQLGPRWLVPTHRGMVYVYIIGERRHLMLQLPALLALNEQRPPAPQKVTSPDRGVPVYTGPIPPLVTDDDDDIPAPVAHIPAPKMAGYNVSNVLSWLGHRARAIEVADVLNAIGYLAAYTTADLRTQSRAEREAWAAAAAQTLRGFMEAQWDVIAEFLDRIVNEE